MSFFTFQHGEVIFVAIPTYMADGQTLSLPSLNYETKEKDTGKTKGKGQKRMCVHAWARRGEWEEKSHNESSAQIS